ncbi:DUF4345 domain-containing protein [Roseivirga sp. E12]|uniref:DUF4345 domain-containing protein n=1 Tax=Roseivirga sp. E12 TaxID=2819237 RepID=UPI001ABC72E9|nr:DUF4345 domain-containing protein [Roseivirga sp. E12]MBO3697535.1 DUF4345 domain-containing protein [Roseivirga sp. E12]
MKARFSLPKNLHLIISLGIVVPFSLVYGISPAENLSQYFDFIVESTDLKNVFRAIMGLYLAISTVWVIGLIKPHFWQVATVLQIVFMLGLAGGRGLSLVLDGIPSQTFVIATILELSLGIYGLLQLKKYAQPISYRSLMADHGGYTYEIQEDLPDIGWYLYQYDDSGNCTHDTLQDNLAMAMKYAEEEFGVSLSTWK